MLKIMIILKTIIIFLVLAPLAIAPHAQAAPVEAPVAAEVSPPGDIPDNQSFVTFTSPSGFSIKVPEGWARKDDGAKTTFSDKYNHLVLQSSDAAQTVSEAFAKSSLVPDLQKNGRAVDKISVKTLALRSGPVVVLQYDSNSEPNAVTNKQIREENESLYFAKANQLITVTLSAPKGADNVDQWNLMANSFQWK